MKKLEEKIRDLQMLPGDWRELWKSLPEGEYRRIQADYRRREQAAKPVCSSPLGAGCPYRRGGRCTATWRCPHARR